MCASLQTKTISATTLSTSMSSWPEEFVDTNYYTFDELTTVSKPPPIGDVNVLLYTIQDTHVYESPPCHIVISDLCNEVPCNEIWIDTTPPLSSPWPTVSTYFPCAWTTLSTVPEVTRNQTFEALDETTKKTVNDSFAEADVDENNSNSELNITQLSNITSYFVNENSSNPQPNSFRQRFFKIFALFIQILMSC